MVTPHVVRMPGITAENLRSIASGTDTNPEIRLDTEVHDAAGGPAAAPAPAAPMPAAAARAGRPRAAGAPAAAASARRADWASSRRRHLSSRETPPRSASWCRTRRTCSPCRCCCSTIPGHLRRGRAPGRFLSGGTQPIAIVQRVDKERGQAIVSATRMPNTPGVSGSGTVFGVVVRGVAPGTRRSPSCR